MQQKNVATAKKMGAELKKGRGTGEGLTPMRRVRIPDDLWDEAEALGVDRAQAMRQGIIDAIAKAKRA